MFFQGKTTVGIPTAIAISKMLNQPQSNNTRSGNESIVDVGGLESIVRQVSRKQNTNEDLLGLFPDMKFCAETVSLSIVSPNDMVTKSYNINFNNLKLGNDLKGTISELIKNELNSYYNLNTNLPDVVEEALFMKGAYVECFIPESSLNDIITDEKFKKAEAGDITVESYIKSTPLNGKGIFNKTQNITSKVYQEILNSSFTDVESISTESAIVNLDKELKVEFIDNVSVLYSNQIADDLTKRNISKSYKDSNDKQLTTESGNKVSLKNEILKVLKDPNKLTQEIMLNIESFSDTSRKSLGRPLHIKLDPAIVKPIWSVTPDNHIGYLVLLDENNSLINSKDYTNDGFDSNTINFSSNTKSVSDSILTRALTGLKSMTEEAKDLDNMEEIYGTILHNTILKKMSDGKLKNIGNLSKDQNFLRLMFSRALKGKKTKVLYLPVDMVSYFAYEYKDNGMGLGRLEKISVLMSMRAIMLFAKLMANIKNSIPITEVEATIDPKEPDIKGAISKIVSSTMKNHQVSLPIGTADVNSLVQWVHSLGYVYNIESERLPSTKIKMNDGSRNIRAPEDSVSEILEELCYMEFFMNTEMVKNSKDANFATSIISQNKLFENRILKQQIKTDTNLTRQAKVIINNDVIIRNEVLKIIKNNDKEIKKLNKDLIGLIEKNKVSDDELYEIILDILLDDMSITLPKPSSLSEGNNLKTALADYTSAVEDYLTNVFDEEAFNAAVAGEEISNNIGYYKAIIKKMLIQEWVNDNNYFPSMSKFLTLDDTGTSLNNLFTQYSDMTEVFGKLILAFNKTNKKQIDKIDNDLNKINQEDEESNIGSNGEEINTEDDNLENDKTSENEEIDLDNLSKDDDTSKEESTDNGEKEETSENKEEEESKEPDDKDSKDEEDDMGLSDLK